VITGHHTGSWGGKRANGRLSLDFLENLSCNPKYSAWFKNVGATWLQGCRTLGVGEIEPDDQQANVDFHTNRVGQALEADGLDQNFADLNMEFSNTLDQDNPLASRYLRLFPQSKIFGWTKTAPGEKARSYLSVLYHIAQTSRLLDEQGQFPSQAPDSDNLSAESAAKYANAVLFTLRKFQEHDQGCEEITVDSWLAQGNVGRPGRYYFDNPDLRAYPSLASTGDHTLQQAKEIDCVLKAAAKSKDPSQMGAALDLIASQPDYLRYSFNTLVDLKNELSKNKSPVAKVILARMRAMPEVQAMLESKMKSKQVGILRKIDYYRFYRDLMGKTDKEMEKEVEAQAIEVFAQPLPAVDPRAEHPERSRNLAADYRATLFQSFLKNGLASEDFYESLLTKNPEADILKSMALQAPRYNRDDATLWLLQISASPNANRATAAAILNTMKAMKIPQAEYNAYYKQIAPLFNKTDVPLVKYTNPNTGETFMLPATGGGLY
jgi:hypothetical protein